MVLRDQPLRPIESAVFWVEHVLRNKGAEHFRNAGQNLHWIQLYLLDIIVFSVLVLLVEIKIVMYLCRFCCGKKKSIEKKDTKKKKQ